jgi:hypothetical protein
MKRLASPTLSLCFALVLAACSGSHNDSSADTSTTSTDDGTSSVSTSSASLESGTYTVDLGDESSPSVAQYFAASDGTRLLIINDSSDAASVVYKATASGVWTRVPASGNSISTTFLSTQSLSLSTFTLSDVAGSYATRVDGSTVSFTLASDGTITAGSSSCKITGSMGDTMVQGVRKLTLVTSGCSTLPSTATGVAILDGNYAPIKLRFVADNGSTLIDLWAQTD